MDAILCSAIDNSLGPWAQNCRGGLDFTLFFEETVLSIFPLVTTICLAPLRIAYLSKKSTKVNRSILLPLKLVSFGYQFP